MSSAPASSSASTPAAHAGTALWRDYQARLAAGQLSPDGAQAEAARALAEFSLRLGGRAPPRRRSWWRRIWQSPTAVPKGVYLWGAVGRGKTMLMDLFFEHAPWEPKRRVHFHSFMRDMHRDIFEWRRAAQARGPDAGDDADPIPPLADRIAAEAALLCFDEMQVSDVTDAMLIRRLFEALQARGVAMVMTSNRPPRDLYLNGLQRGQFLPFIAALEERMDVVELASPTDFRRRQLARLEQTYVMLRGPEADAWLERHFLALTHGQSRQPLTLQLPGRSWAIAESAGDVAKATFAGLCDQALGASDYMELARHVSTLLLADIPLLDPAMRNASKRFVTLIDVLYEARVKLLATAAAAPDDLYPKGDGSFEFARTASRLIEMQSDAYRALPWLRPPALPSSSSQ